MPVSLESSSLSLRAVMRPALALAPEDSLARFVQMLRQHALTALPILQQGRLCGILSQEDVLPILATHSPEERERALRSPVSDWMRPPRAVARPEMTPQEAGELCAEHGLSLIPVVDADNYCLGVILASDLLVPDMPLSRPATIGGMATPFGVYLTTGSLQAGASNGALVVTGMILGLLGVLAYALIAGALWLAHRYAHLPNGPLFDPSYVPPLSQPVLGFVSLGWNLVFLIVFLLLMRATRLAGYHAAEHQAVHAIEREERLVPDIVSRMPRPHPRCGTNLMAAGMLFYGFWQAFQYVPGLDDAAPVLAVLVTALTWRRVGTLLQERFTTKPANDREIASGIAAGKALLEKYLNSPPTRPRLLRRVWCSGLLQALVGMSFTSLVVWLILRGWAFWQH